MRMLECVCNISEALNAAVVEQISQAGGDAVIDVHTDVHHNRSVLTLAGKNVEDAIREVAGAAISMIDLREHAGVHPRFGVVDVVPFVPLELTSQMESTLQNAIDVRSRFAQWLAARGVPSFFYGPERSLPFVRLNAFADLRPDAGPDRPHVSAGSTAVGARHTLIAYNLWLVEPDLNLARHIARSMRNESVRALGLQVGSHVQVSCNLVQPSRVGPGAAYDRVAREAAIAQAELVGLIPNWVLTREPPHRWSELDIDPSRTIEVRLAGAGLL